jgi:hypothetical protein
MKARISKLNMALVMTIRTCGAAGSEGRRAAIRQRAGIAGDGHFDKSRGGFIKTHGPQERQAGYACAALVRSTPGD